MEGSTNAICRSRSDLADLIDLESSLTRIDPSVQGGCLSATCESWFGFGMENISYRSYLRSFRFTLSSSTRRVNYINIAPNGHETLWCRMTAFERVSGPEKRCAASMISDARLLLKLNHGFGEARIRLEVLSLLVFDLTRVVPGSPTF